MIPVPETTWSIGHYVGIAFAILAAVFVVTAIIAVVAALRSKYPEDLWLLTGALVALAIITGGITAWGNYPYDAEYHQWRGVQGEVTHIDKRLISAGDKGMSERFVVTIDGVGERGCDDTRCAGVDVGDVLTLVCKREWQFTGTDGYGCNYIGTTRKAAA